MAPDWQQPPSWPDAAVLQHGAAVTCDLTPLGSNYTFLVCLEGEDGRRVQAIYKPSKGEAPLWDFPYGTLHLRETASYRLSAALGWGFIPETIVREGPHGIGSMQRYVEHDPREHYFTLREHSLEQFPRICLFDLLTNNADRKAGHTLRDPAGRIWGIDHGLTFHPHPKLRTVIWDFAGEPIDEALVGDLRRLQEQLDRADDAVLPVTELLHPREVEALQHRLALLLEDPVFPDPRGARLPWPWM